jgi:hypothetical protein
MIDVIRPPWTVEHVAALNRFQRCGRMHPFTCGNRNRDDTYRAYHETAVEMHNLSDLGQLHATTDGWVCSACDYTQDWAFAFMLEVADWKYPWEVE